VEVVRWEFVTMMMIVKVMGIIKLLAIALMLNLVIFFTISPHSKNIIAS